MVVYVGIDPSYKRTGISIYCEGKVRITSVSLESDPNKSFEKIYLDVQNQVSQIIRAIRGKVALLGPDLDFKVLTECPPPQGSFAPGLWALDVSMIKELKGMGAEVFRVCPNYIGHFHGKRTFNKSESVEKAKVILKKFDHSVDGRLSHDQAESFIFLCRLLSREGILDKEIGKEFPALTHEKEKEVG